MVQKIFKLWVLVMIFFGVANAGTQVDPDLALKMLNNQEKLDACTASVNAGAAFVKTSTGLAGGGATAEDVKLMRNAVGPNIGVKASGGIRSLQDALVMIDAGASRIGTSAGVEIVTTA